MQPPEKEPQSVEYFIDRENYNQNFISFLQHDSIVQLVGDTQGAYGIGKTTILSKLYHDVQGMESLYPLWLSLSQFSVDYINPNLKLHATWWEHDLKSGYDEIQVWAQNLISYYELLVELGQALIPNVRKSLDEINTRLLKALLRRETDLTPHVVDSMELPVDFWLRLASPDCDTVADHRVTFVRERTFLREAIQQAADELTRAFVFAFNHRADPRRVVVFADDYGWISQEQIGLWFYDGLIPALINVVVVIARLEDSPLVREDRSIPLPLGNFTPEEVSQYLEKRLGLDPLPPRLAENIYAFSSGLPLTVCLAADLLKYSTDDDGDQAEFMTMFEHLEENNAISESLKNLLASVEKRSIRLARALETGAIVRRFDGALISTVLAEFFPEEDDEGLPDMQGNVLLDLEKYSFVELRRDAQGSFYYAFHHLVRENLDRVIVDRDQQRGTRDYQTLHSLVAGYYDAQIQAYEEQQADQSDYVKLYRYEDAAWQKVIKEWLYHLGHLEDRAVAHFQFANIYFLAFQWWGWYLRFPFCEHLLEQWEWTQQPEADRELLALIRKFHTSYPTGYFSQKRGHPGWAGVREAIEQVHLWLGLTGDPDTLDEDRRALRALINEFLAPAYRFAPEPDLDTAAEIHREAIRIFEAFGDDGYDWNASYHYCFLADVYLENNEIDRAIEAANEGQRIGSRKSIDDPEVISFSHRILGDAYVRTGRLARAAPEYAQASFYAYTFLVYPIKPPDPYTIQWYHDLCVSMTDQIVGLADAGQTPQAIAMLKEIYAFWQAYWENPPEETELARWLAGDRPETLAWRVFPANAPGPDEPLDSEFCQKARRLVDTINAATKDQR